MTHHKADGMESLRAVTPVDLRKATLEVHQAVQLIPSAAGALLPPRPDDSHRAMTWIREVRAFASEPIGRDLRLAVVPEDLAVGLLAADGAWLTRSTLAEKTMGEAYRWAAEALSRHLAAEPVDLSPPEFEIPPNPVGEGGRFSQGWEAERRAVAELYTHADETLAELLAGRVDAAPFRCWPHHFDIASLLTVRAAPDPEDVRTVGVGMAPMGSGYEGWYWYVNLWPYPDPEDLPPLRGPGHWHTDGWVGAVLTGKEALGKQSLSKAVAEFVSGAVDIATALLR